MCDLELDEVDRRPSLGRQKPERGIMATELRATEAIGSCTASVFSPNSSITQRPTNVLGIAGLLGAVTQAAMTKSLPSAIVVEALSIRARLVVDPQVS
jgi:hypothetical protein